jgi:hypothetical protein
MMTVPDEMLGFSSLCIVKDGKVVEIDKKKGDWVDGRQRKRALREHPDAFFVWRVPYKALWVDMALEPIGKHGIDWFKEPGQLDAHNAKMKRSLEIFLNGKLKRLDRMVRTGWWILEKARVRVSTFREVPNEPRTQTLAEMSGRRRPRKKSR